MAGRKDLVERRRKILDDVSRTAVQGVAGSALSLSLSLSLSLKKKNMEVLKHGSRYRANAQALPISSLCGTYMLLDHIGPIYSSGWLWTRRITPEIKY